jgi:hypothetical protein
VHSMTSIGLRALEQLCFFGTERPATRQPPNGRREIFPSIWRETAREIVSVEN